MLPERAFEVISRQNDELVNLTRALQKKNLELEEALKRVRQLEGLLPICASCKKVRDEGGTWEPIEAYIRSRTRADFSHGICPECEVRLYPAD